MSWDLNKGSISHIIIIIVVIINQGFHRGIVDEQGAFLGA